MERQQNELPEFMSYKDKFTQSGFIEKISKIAKRAGSKLVYAALILYYTLQSESVSLKDKTMILAALGYLISPLDVMPDAIPIAGLSDDIPEDVKEKAHNKLTKWFDEEEVKDADSINF